MAATAAVLAEISTSWSSFPNLMWWKSWSFVQETVGSSQRLSFQTLRLQPGLIFDFITKFYLVNKLTVLLQFRWRWEEPQQKSWRGTPAEVMERCCLLADSTQLVQPASYSTEDRQPKGWHPPQWAGPSHHSRKYTTGLFLSQYDQGIFSVEVPQWL